MDRLEAPYFPIIYVRGYAMTPGEVADTVATPYMGFNLGATKIRQRVDGSVQRHIFESPLIRLMKDHGYRDLYSEGSEIGEAVSARSVVIYRYYEPGDRDLGEGRVGSIEEAARGLKTLIRNLREQVCGNDTARRQRFRVHLVAHSMGGLVCRCFLQNDQISTPADRQLVDKVFTYATPHNGIELSGFNVPSVLGMWDMNNFNRKRMAEYLDLPAGTKRVDSLNGKFEADRFFCFVGTNHRDYAAAAGLSRRLVGEMSDGLVQISNATVLGAPRAFAYRAHSGHYGVVNSEEGYQNLERFLFGNRRVDGVLHVDALPLPPSVRKAWAAGRKVEAPYYFEASVAPRGAVGYRLSERRRDTFCAVLRRFDELFDARASAVPDATAEFEEQFKVRVGARSPVLFSAFLDTRKIAQGRTMVFTVELAVSTSGYSVDGRLWNQHVEGEYLFRDTLTLRITDTSMRYVLTDETWSEHNGRLAERDGENFIVPLSSKKGFAGRLYLSMRRTDG